MGIRASTEAHGSSCFIVPLIPVRHKVRNGAVNRARRLFTDLADDILGARHMTRRCSAQIWQDVLDRDRDSRCCLCLNRPLFLGCLNVHELSPAWLRGFDTSALEVKEPRGGQYEQ